MSEHKYLMSEYLVPRDEWKYRLDVVYQRDIDKQELAALRAELKAAQGERDTYRLAMLGVNDAYKECKSERDRMRKALEGIDKYIGSLLGVPEVMWNDAIALISETVFLALNPQPAQPEKQAKPSDLPALIELARDYVQKMSPEDTAEAWRLSAISFAFGNVSIHNPNVTYAMVEKSYGKTFPENQND